MHLGFAVAILRDDMPCGPGGHRFGCRLVHRRKWGSFKREGRGGLCTVWERKEFGTEQKDKDESTEAKGE